MPVLVSFRYRTVPASWDADNDKNNPNMKVVREHMCAWPDSIGSLLRYLACSPNNRYSEGFVVFNVVELSEDEYCEMLECFLGSRGMCETFNDARLVKAFIKQNGIKE